MSTERHDTSQRLTVKPLPFTLLPRDDDGAMTPSAASTPEAVVRASPPRMSPLPASPLPASPSPASPSPASPSPASPSSHSPQTLKITRSTPSKIVSRYVMTSRTRDFYRFMGLATPRPITNLVNKLNKLSMDPEFLLCSSKERTEFCERLLRHLSAHELPEALRRVRRRDVSRCTSPRARQKMANHRKTYKCAKDRWFKRARSIAVFVALHCDSPSTLTRKLRAVHARLDHALIWLTIQRHTHKVFERAEARLREIVPLDIESVYSYKGTVPGAWATRTSEWAGKEFFDAWRDDPHLRRLVDKPRYKGLVDTLQKVFRVQP